MSATAAMLSAEDYERRKLFLPRLKILSKIQQEELYRILKDSGAEYSENHNGIFFDICKLPAHVFDRMCQYVEFCKKNLEAERQRDEHNRIVHKRMLDGDSD
jgi:hypothetical protein